METVDPLKLLIPLLGSTIFICLLSTLSLHLIWLLPVFAAMTFAMQAQLFHTRSLSKAVTNDQIATQTIETFKYPVRFVQNCVRTLRGNTQKHPQTAF